MTKTLASAGVFWCTWNVYCSNSIILIWTQLFYDRQYMRFARPGQDFWKEWDGYEYPVELDNQPFIYFTEGWADFTHESVVRSLAFFLQREGVFETVSEGIKILENAYSYQGYAVHLDGEDELTFYDQDYYTWPNHEKDDPREITWVEVPRGN